MAIKLRKRIGELTLQNKSLEENHAKLEQEKTDLEEKLQKLGTAAKNVQSIQSEYDKITDELEKKKLENASNEKVYTKTKSDMEKLESDVATANATISQFKKDLEFSKMEKASLDMVIKELQSQISSLKTNSGDLKVKDAEVTKIKGVYLIFL